MKTIFYSTVITMFSVLGLQFQVDATPVTDIQPEFSSLIPDAQPPRDRVRAIHQNLIAQRYDMAVLGARMLVDEGYVLEGGKLLLLCNQRITELLKPRLEHNKPTIFDMDAYSKEEAGKLVIPLSDPGYVQENMELFDVQMNALLYLEAKLEHAIALTADQELVHLHEEVTKRKEEVAQARTNYLSFDVISPILAEGHRKAFLAIGIFSNDEEKLDMAADLIARACNNPDFVFELDEKVQRQFLDVIDYIKENHSDQKWERAQTRTSLIRALDSQQKSGQNSWISRLKATLR